MRIRFVFASVLLAFGAIGLDAAVNDERYWAQWRGPAMTGVSKTAKPPLEWSETKNIKWKVQIPGRGSSSPVGLERSRVLLTAIPVGVAGDAQHAPRGALPQRGLHQYKVLAIDRKTGKTVWEHVAREEEPHEAGPRRQRLVGVELGDHRRHARLRVFRVTRAVRVRHERQADLAGRLRRQEDAQPVRRRIDAGPVWQHAGRGLGSSQPAVLRDCARQAHRQGIVARRSSRDGHLGHAAGGRARRAAAGHRQCDESRAQLRSRDRQDRVGRPGHDHERDSVAGVRPRHGVHHERLPRQQPEGDQARRRQGRHQHAPARLRGSSIATRRTCRRRCSTTTSCIS